MKTITLKVRKAYVFDEVKKASEYIGTRLVTEQDPNAFARLRLTDADDLMIERLWQEGCQVCTQVLRRYLVSVSDIAPVGNASDLSKNYVATLEVPDGFETALVPGLESSLTSYVITSTLAKWCIVADRPDAQAYTELSGVCLQDINRKLFKRNRPARA